MLRTYTDRGKAWETANSWWVLLTLGPFGITSFLSFLYIGFKVRHLRWKIAGMLYLAIFSVSFYLVMSELGRTVEGLGVAIVLSMWIVSIVHAFRVRSAFLIQLDVYKANEKVRTQQKMTQIRQEAEAKFQTTGKNTQFQPPVPKKKAEAQQPDDLRNEEHKDNHHAETETPPADISQTGLGRRIDY